MYRLLFGSNDDETALLKTTVNRHAVFSWYNASENSLESQDSKNKVIYVGMFGLGHRLSKLAGAHHFVQTYGKRYWPMDTLEILWGSCSATTNSTDQSPTDDGHHHPDIFTNLFGHNQIEIYHHRRQQLKDPRIPRRVQKQLEQLQQQYHQGKSLVIRNDVAGYYAGQVYKNAQISLRQSQLSLDLWEEKLDMDADLYRNLLASFEAQHGAQMLEPFQNEHHWKQHYIVGLHIRDGNGEEQHFEQAQREIANSDEFLDNLVDTIQDYLGATNSSSSSRSSRKEVRRRFPGARPRKKTPLIFVATDTASMVDQLQRRFARFHIPVVAVEQPRVPPHQGVSYSAWTAGTEHCWHGWLYSMVDMALLAKSNIVIAARRSTFTQTMPRSLLLDEPEVEMANQPKKSRFFYHVRGYKFCEVGDTGASMTCFATRNAWMLRHDPNSVSRRSRGDDDAPWDIGQMPLIRNFGKDNQTSAVVHKLMVHFPDVIFSSRNRSHNDHDEDVQWLKRAQEFWNHNQTDTLRMQFGTKIAKKYRRYKDFRADWKLQ